MDETEEYEADLSQETPPDHVFLPPSITKSEVLAGQSYTYMCPLPKAITNDMETECVLGVDEAGRGPVIGPMVYGLFFLPTGIHKTLLADTHHFDDSKVLTPVVRANLMKTLCSAESDLFASCGWATRVMSARDISAGMYRSGGSYNLNAQAMDATIDLVQAVLAARVNVVEIYIDTIGSPITYQRKLERIFPGVRITVAKKADSLYPCVSAASVCAKVTRDAALEVCYESYQGPTSIEDSGERETALSKEGWGSGYPSDARCVNWLKHNVDPIFGFGSEGRFSWSTIKDMLDNDKQAALVEWPDEEDDGNDHKVSSYFKNSQDTGEDAEEDELACWFGRRVTQAIF